MPEQRDILQITATDRRAERPSYVTGIWGGLGGNSPLIIAHLFADIPTAPSSVRIKINENNQVIGEEGSSSYGDITREYLGSFAMEPQSAISIGNWLIERGQEALALQQGE